MLLERVKLMIDVRFENKPVIEPVPGDESWQLVHDFYVRVVGIQFTVPAGFVTDGASIPRFLWRICGHPMSTKRLPIAIFHDYAYAGGLPFPRQSADRIYRDGLIKPLGFPRWKAELEYYALRLFGGAHWRGTDS